MSEVVVLSATSISGHFKGQSNPSSSPLAPTAEDNTMLQRDDPNYEQMPTTDRRWSKQGMGCEPPPGVISRELQPLPKAHTINGRKA